MTLKEFLLYFFTGGIVTVIIVGLEESGLRLWSGLATLIPVFTLVSYFFIGNSSGGLAVSQHSKFVLIGTLVSWVPYMLAIAILAPKIGSNRAIAWGLVIFFILALGFLFVVDRYRLFR
ncbi:MAG: hypothetical protein P4L74_01050 [Candidatus Doudnabacteria bacterium]|nr:hypothetical protein [Candidatus Doudnabacteria bacterium]